MLFQPSRAPLAAALLAAGALAPAHAQESVAIRAGKVITVTGAEIEDATIVIQDGIITDVLPAGADAPWNAKVVDAKDKVVMPTWVLPHQSGGLSGGTNENLANVPFLTVEDAIDPSSTFYEECLRNGVGTIHNVPGNRTLIGGRGRIVQPYGKTVENMTVRTEAGLKLSLQASRSGGTIAQIRAMRRALRDVVDYRAEYERKKAEWQKAKEAGAVEEDEFPEEIDPLKEPVIDLLEGERTGFLYVPTAAEVPEVQRMLETYPEMKLVLVLGADCHEAADRIAEIGVPVILDDGAVESFETDPETREETLVSLAKQLYDRNVRFALSLSDGTSGPTHYPWWQMASCVRNGVDRATAIRAMTIEPAKMLGLDGLGAIEKGKIANLQILTGDPLKATTWVDSVMLEGQVVYERAKDKRLEYLFGTER